MGDAEAAAAAGSASRSLTSSAVTLQTRNQRMMVRVERNPKKKGYLRLHTTLGDLNLELHCDIVPRTCENFIALAESGYYNDTVFHRSIRNFMIQVRQPLEPVRPGFKPMLDDDVSTLVCSLPLTVQTPHLGLSSCKVSSTNADLVCVRSI